jgi:hypothetical protein
MRLAGNRSALAECARAGRQIGRIRLCRRLIGDDRQRCGHRRRARIGAVLVAPLRDLALVSARTTSGTRGQRAAVLGRSVATIDSHARSYNSLPITSRTSSKLAAKGGLDGDRRDLDSAPVRRAAKNYRTTLREISEP